MDLRNMLNEPSSTAAAAGAASRPGHESTSRPPPQHHQHHHQQHIPPPPPPPQHQQHHHHQQQQQHQPQNQRQNQVHQIHPQAQPQHHPQQHSHSAPPQMSAPHHRPPPSQSPLQPSPSQHYSAPGYALRQQPPPGPPQQQSYPPAHSGPHGPSPANQYPYAPSSPHGGPPPPSAASQPTAQHQYSYAHSKGPPGSYGPTSGGHPAHPSHQQYPQQQQPAQQQQQPPHHHLQHQQHPHQHHLQHHPGGNSNAGSPLQPQFYPPHSPHQQQFNQHYQRHPNSPRGQRPPMIQTVPSDRALQPPPPPSNAVRNPRERDRDRQLDRDRSISPKTIMYPEDFDRERDSVMRDDPPSGYQGSHPGAAAVGSGGGVSSVKGSKTSSHHRNHSQGTSQPAPRRGSAIAPQQPSINQLQRNMDVDSEADGRTWNANPATPVDRKGVNGFDLGSHVRENSQALQTQNTPMPNPPSSNATSAVPAAHPLSSAPPPPPSPATQQHHLSSVNNLQRTITSSPIVKEQPPFLPPNAHRSTPSVPPLPLNRISRPPSPKVPRDREIQPPPTPGSMSGSRKRPRHDEMPIFARKASRSTSNSPVMPNRRGPQPQLIQQQQQQQIVQQQQQQQENQQAGPHTPIQRQNTGPPQGAIAQPPPAPPPTKTPTPTQAPLAPQPMPPQPIAPPPNRMHNPYDHPLAPWEPSITNSIPYDEITHKITEFIFNRVVKLEDPSLDWTGSGGPMIEIEAKLGHLINRNNNQRLRIGIRTEAIIEEWDYFFRSSMTEQQHKRFNGFLNERFAETQPRPPPPPRSPSPTSSPNQANNHNRHLSGPPPRVPMEYKHTRERDTFHELTPQAVHALPPIVQSLSKKSPRVRVTTDSKTGKVINKIIKCRIADLNVHSPATAFDWRVSVNLEMPYTGGLEEKDGVLPANQGKGNAIERNKDRMSYKCLGGKFKVDLTQVSPSDNSKKEHELEVELDTMAVKKQGTLAMRNAPNGFEELLKGFVNNIRVLTRAVDDR